MNIEAIVIGILLVLAASYVGYVVLSKFLKKGCGSACGACQTSKKPRARR